MVDISLLELFEPKKGIYLEADALPVANEQPDGRELPDPVAPDAGPAEALLAQAGLIAAILGASLFMVIRKINF